MMPLENATSERGRLLDPLSLAELPQDRTAWLVIDGAAYAPTSIKAFIERWEEDMDVQPEASVTVASFQRWTRGHAGRYGAYSLRNPLRQDIALSRSALRKIYDMLSEQPGRTLRCREV